jgi:hypothetical protein
VKGAAGERLTAVRVGTIELVVGVVPRTPRPAAATLRRYDAAIRELMAVYGSVLPARFGTCAASAEEIAASVRDRRAAIRRTLRLVRHRAQMTIRIFGSESVQSAFRVRSECGDGATQGTRYLQQRAADLQIPGAEPLRAAAARWIRAERSERHAQGRLAGSLYHLVPRRSVAAYRRAVERAALDAGLTTIVSGPWPPYAFTE